MSGVDEEEAIFAVKVVVEGCCSCIKVLLVVEVVEGGG
jgi:hypothetical protein